MNHAKKAAFWKKMVIGLAIANIIFWMTVFLVLLI